MNDYMTKHETIYSSMNKNFLYILQEMPSNINITYIMDAYNTIHNENMDLQINEGYSIYGAAQKFQNDIEKQNIRFSRFLLVDITEINLNKCIINFDWVIPFDILTNSNSENKDILTGIIEDNYDGLVSEYSDGITTDNYYIEDYNIYQNQNYASDNVSYRRYTYNYESTIGYEKVYTSSFNIDIKQKILSIDIEFYSDKYTTDYLIKNEFWQNIEFALVIDNITYTLGTDLIIDTIDHLENHIVIKFNVLVQNIEFQNYVINTDIKKFDIYETELFVLKQLLNDSTFIYSVNSMTKRNFKTLADTPTLDRDYFINGTTTFINSLDNPEHDVRKNTRDIMWDIGRPAGEPHRDPVHISSRVEQYGTAYSYNIYNGSYWDRQEFARFVQTGPTGYSLEYIFRHEYIPITGSIKSEYPYFIVDTKVKATPTITVNKLDISNNNINIKIKDLKNDVIEYDVYDLINNCNIFDEYISTNDIEYTTL